MKNKINFQLIIIWISLRACWATKIMRITKLRFICLCTINQNVYTIWFENFLKIYLRLRVRILVFLLVGTYLRNKRTLFDCNQWYPLDICLHIPIYLPTYTYALRQNIASYVVLLFLFSWEERRGEERVGGGGVSHSTRLKNICNKLSHLEKLPSRRSLAKKFLS